VRSRRQLARSVPSPNEPVIDANAALSLA